MEELQLTTFQERFHFLQCQIENKFFQKTMDGLHYVISECQFDDLVKKVRSFSEADKKALLSIEYY